ncbi:hypothetical protein BDP67DRAFT_538466 [Colletotrichum lupini]|nr:hypothetical protein BDP67DRAFT_538466 [Colletotrichum lupini]
MPVGSGESNGTRPRCLRCTNDKCPCVYPAPEGLSERQAQKQALFRTSRAYRSAHNVLKLIQSSEDRVVQDLVQQLRDCTDLDDTIESIGNADLVVKGADEETQNTVSQNLGPNLGATNQEPIIDPRSRSGCPTSLSNVKMPLSEFSLADGQSSGFIDNLGCCSVLPVSRWTNVSDDDEALTSLLHLFWTWDSTLSNIVDKGRFVADLCSGGPGLTIASQKVFCSSFLVNAVLTVSALHSARRCYAFDPNAIALARLFADEACQLLKSERRVGSLTFLQGASILWFVTCNEKSLVTFGTHENLPKLVREAWSELGFEKGDFTVFNFSDMGTPSQMRDWHTISHINWGFYCFFMEAAESVSAKFLSSKPLVTKIIDNQSHWHDLRTPSPRTHIFEAPYQLEVFGLKYSLYQIMEESISAVPLDPARCVAVYRLLHQWKLALPDHLDMGNSIASSVLSLHVSYESIALKVVTIYESNSTTPYLDGWDAGSLQLHHAKSMVILLWTYRCLYDTKFDRWAANQCSVVIRILLLVYASNITLFAIYDIISKAHFILNEMAYVGVVGHAKELLEDIEMEARGLNVCVPSHG